jgi:hypothetical protein
MLVDFFRRRQETISLYLKESCFIFTFIVSVLNDSYTFFQTLLILEGQAGESWELGEKSSVISDIENTRIRSIFNLFHDD